jgi:hypothetical protein
MRITPAPNAAGESASPLGAAQARQPAGAFALNQRFRPSRITAVRSVSHALRLFEQGFIEIDCSTHERCLVKKVCQ